MTFTTFSEAVHSRYNDLAKGELFTVDVLDIFASYLNAFPEGTNPIFRQRTEHDCNCCKNFIRRLGNVVGIGDDGTLRTVWDNYQQLPHPYDLVGMVMSNLVRQAPISGLFRTKENSFGSGPNYDNHDSNIRWTHFYGKVERKHLTSAPDKIKGDANTTVAVFKRGLEELTDEAFDTVIELIEEGQLYRGDQHLSKVKDFRKMRTEYEQALRKDLFVWTRYDTPAARVRNSAIGTLLIDLSEGTDVEVAVRKFSTSVMAPTNFMRSKTLATPKMIDKALDTLKGLGLYDKVFRRYARASDLKVSDVLFKSGQSGGALEDPLRAALMSDAKATTRRKPTSADSISAETFFRDILPGARTLQIIPAVDDAGRFMSLTHGEEGLFQWDNGFAWTYDGEVTDSIKQRVKTAGGNINAKLRLSLAWWGGTDLDLHAQCPEGHVMYNNKMGVLDVDMNGLDKQNLIDPVENLSWARPRDGNYEIWVHNYSARTESKPGFEIEFFFNGETLRYRYDKFVPGSAKIPLVTFKIKNGEIVGLTFAAHLEAGSAASTMVKWGIKTGVAAEVSHVLLSPNFWGDNEAGNKHWFFILKDAKNPDAVPGFYNEYLRPSLHEHRKVFEQLKSKTKCQPTDDQLSGLGFSSTVPAKVSVLVNDRPYVIEF